MCQKHMLLRKYTIRLHAGLYSKRISKKCMRYWVRQTVGLLGDDDHVRMAA